jgi:hypothetical protein
MTAPRRIDVVVHFHGNNKMQKDMHVVDDILAISGLDFADPDHLSIPGRQRPTLAILPRGEFIGNSRFRFPSLVRPGGLDKLINDCLRHFTDATGVKAKRGRLVLTAHSGGGITVEQILDHTDPDPDPDEIHYFDAFYGKPYSLISWAQRHIARDAGPSQPFQRSGALRALYFDTGTKGNMVQACAALRKALAGATGLGERYRIAETSTGHCLIPRRYGWRLLPTLPPPCLRPRRSRASRRPSRSSRLRRPLPALKPNSSPPKTSPSTLRGQRLLYHPYRAHGRRSELARYRGTGARGLARCPPSRIYRPLNVWIAIVDGHITAAVVALFSPHGGIGNRQRATWDATHLPIDWKPTWMRSPMKSTEAPRCTTTIDLVVVHCPDRSDIGPAINTFLSASEIGNAHYLIDHNGHIIKMAEDGRKANHTGFSRWRGNSNLNAISIGIEVMRAPDGFSRRRWPRSRH